ncbi:MFS transporter [Ancylobacter sonchi]|uniref:MFS transporter n=1 Tax=Ancylobacter sonchi TaxID=1937790 RepID=UPI001BD5599D|nr:MFS transporter [Ancylobacter sonchi]MBS7533180.1 MFS transporter [Ancylobacter sonchi]
MSAPAPDLPADNPVTRGARSHHPGFAVAAVMVGTFLAAFDSRLFTVGLADLRGGFSLGYDEGAWLSTAALAPQILIAPAVAWLATTFGVRRLLGVPSLVYAAISLLIPFVRHYELLVVLHVARGLLLGVFVPATLLIILRNLSMQWWLPAIALYAFRSAFTLNSGAALGGYYVQTLGWQWMYWQDALVAPVMALLVYVGVPRERVDRGLLVHADWGGMLLFGAGLTLIYVGLDQGNRLDWLESGTVVATLAGGAALIVAFWINELLHPEPWASAKVLMSRNILLMLGVTVLFTLTSVSNSLLVPNFLDVIGTLRPEQTGELLFGSVALPLIGFTVLAVFLLRRIDARIVLTLGLGAFALASLMATRLTGVWRLDDFVPVTLLQSAGHGLTFVAIIVIALSNANPKRATAFSAYIQVLRLGGAQIGLALMMTWLRIREQVHSHQLGQHVSDGEASVEQAMAALASRFTPVDAGSAYQRALSSLASLVKQQANVLAYIDGFQLCYWLALAGLLLVALMKAPPPGPLVPRA